MQAAAEGIEEKRLLRIVNEMAFPETTVVLPSDASGTRLVSVPCVRMDRPSRVHFALSSGGAVLEEIQIGGEGLQARERAAHSEQLA